MRMSVLFLVLIFTASCGTREQEVDFTFIHATDPHLFEEPAKESSGGNPEPADVRRHKEKLNTGAFSAFLESIRSLSGADARRRLVVLTGDFGIDRSWTDQAESKLPSGKQSHETHRRAEQVKLLASLLRSSPVTDVYVVPGNNDLEDERATEQALGTVSQFFQDVQKELDGVALRSTISPPAIAPQANRSRAVPLTSPARLSVSSGSRRIRSRTAQRKRMTRIGLSSMRSWRSSPR